MKVLYIVRHAKSSWDEPFQDDFDRPLNKRGRSDAPRMAKRLKERRVQPDLILSSPAERALSTAILMAEKAGYNRSSIHTDSGLYHANDDKLLGLVHGLNDGNNEVMIVAHNPGLTDFVNRLNSEPITGNIPTCGVVCVKVDVTSWKDVKWGQGELGFFDYPKKHP